MLPRLRPSAVPLPVQFPSFAGEIESLGVRREFLGRPTSEPDAVVRGNVRLDKWMNFFDGCSGVGCCVVGLKKTVSPISHWSQICDLSLLIYTCIRTPSERRLRECELQSHAVPKNRPAAHFLKMPR
ncbi:hypothetical protein Zmor_000157 [Zophobas morio]|uniref:Uncharacterized protein n=1 Tax=Zophobas morio TaxID=2755281 RepID=A0AA38IVS8_9CUCU|nr:hypothetical protein Zmor_000157 [Zophobas morio]